MNRFLLALGLTAGLVGSATPARGQFVPPGADRAAQQQVVRWFQAYLGRQPNVQEAAVLTNQYLLSGNALYVQSVLLASNEFVAKAGGTPAGYINRLFLVTLGRPATIYEANTLQTVLYQNGRMWFAQAFLTQLAQSNGWGGYNANRFTTLIVPVPIVVPIIIR